MVTENDTYGLEETVAQGLGDVEEAGDGAMGDEKRFKRLAASRVYFVRLPKPAELQSTSEVDKQKDAIDEKLRKLSEELQPVMSEKNRNSGQLAEAREAVRELKAQIEDKELILNPYRQERKAIQQDREAQRRTRDEQRQAERKAREEQFRSEQNAKQKVRNDFSNQYGHLGVSNDDEIDDKVRALEFKQQHESLTIYEEKAVLKQIKQLQESREAVRTYSQWAAEDKAEREAKAAQAKKRKEEKDRKPAKEKGPQSPRQSAALEQDQQKEEMDELKRIVDGLWEDYKMALDIKNKHQDIENGLKAKIEALFEKRDSLRKEREGVWAKIQKHRSSIRAANKPFSDNRAFSGQVRELVKSGKVEEARQLCAQQTTELMGQYASDAGFRSEYNTLWDAAAGHSRPAASVSESHHSAAASVIAEALEAARRSVASKHAKTKESEAKPAEALKPKRQTENGAAPAPAAAPAAHQASKPATIPGMEEADRPKPKAKKDKKGPKLPEVEIPKIDDTPFVPPAIVKGKSVAPLSAEELKEQERVRNKAAAAEAVLRKERRRQAQEKKRMQKAQQRAEQQSAPQAKEELSEEVSAPETPPVEEVGVKLTSNAAPEGLSAAVTKETSKLKGGSGKSLGVKERKAALPKPRPFARKKTMYGSFKAYSRQLYSTAEEHPLVVGLSSLAAVAMALAPALYYYR